ncbi:MAG TPA: isoleucine--tRNA ligase [Candidatus Saccharimonadales bacterium]|nr:isoleucine--tRNA ligase [Candidatus Saccharimonadales bacterium]
MKFKSGERRKPAEYEKDLIKQWKKNKVFEKSVEQRPVDNSYVFYDGPPFITGVPHHGTLLSSIVKDAVPRYWTMKGKRVERVWGWDCHGLPAEVFTEKKLGITDRRDIGTKVSLEEYILTCRDNMVQTGSLWEDTIDRVGRWVDFKGAYKTMDKDYMESVWWAFSELYKKGKIYEGEKVLLYCTRDATPISKAEVAMDNSYQDVTDPSVYVKFKLQGEDDRYLLAWTTTPWTLPGNTAIAVNKAVTYAEIDLEGEKLILAKDRLDKVLTDNKHEIVSYKVNRTFKGSELVGESYEPLFVSDDKNKEKINKIWHADYVSIEEGTGIVHLAPAYGEEDYELSKDKGFPLKSVIDENGFYISGEWEGQNVWEANKPIAKHLEKANKVWKIEYITHSYPHCHRCGTKLMYRAHPSWFMDVEGQKQLMLEQNGDINWFPEHIKQGRFAKTIQTAPDWNISRDRFWATAMPVWKGKDSKGKTHMKVIGSYKELKDLSGLELDDYHKPWIDDVTFTIDNVKYKRIDKVLDCWFESGSMPFAQYHYPFENRQKFEESFPGDFISEYIGQVRAWFYYLHVISSGLFDENSFKNVIVTGTLSGNDGRKMSKSYGNYTDPNELMDKYSADAYRLLLLGSPLLNGEDFALIDKDIADIHRKLSMIWNMYDFFTLYAEVDEWQWSQSPNAQVRPTDHINGLSNPLDIWIVSRIHQLGEQVDGHMQRYDIPNAVKLIIPFIEDASNWYVRRSRKRFWKSDNDSDKNNAYSTLHYTLTTLSVILAPFTPFLSEELYQRLTGDKSVHLVDWPEFGHVDELLIGNMKKVRSFIADGLAIRATEGIKVRQPLKSVTIPEIPDTYTEMIQDELNVKEVKFDRKIKVVKLDTNIDASLKAEGQAREVIRHVQNARKKAGLSVNDRIILTLSTTGKHLKKAIDDHNSQIMKETLAVKTGEREQNYTTSVSIDDEELVISLQKS